MKKLAPMILFIILLLQGCASYLQHEMDITSSGTNRREHMSPQIFPGTFTDVRLTGMTLSSPVTCWFSDYIAWWSFILVPIPITDTLPSFVADIIYLPEDIAFWSNKHQKEKKSEPKKPDDGVLPPQI